MANPSLERIRSLNREELAEFLEIAGESLTEQEALAVMDNRFCNAQICLQIANSTRLTSFYSVRANLVAHRATPQGHALKFVHYLLWRDLLRFSTETRINASVRRAIDGQMLARLPKLTLGERIASARSCSRELIKKLLFDHEPRVFENLLNNPRLTEDDLVAFIDSEKATADPLAAIANHRKWSFRYPIRRSLVTNPVTPRAVAASQLRFLQRQDLQGLLRRPETSVYLRRCIERILEESPHSDRGIRKAEADQSQ